LRGYIYVLRSEERPSVVKIGRTERSPEIRCKQHNIDCYLSINTWEVHYWRWVEDCIASEVRIHKLLQKHKLKVKAHREVFKISLEVAMDVVVRICDSYPAKSDQQVKVLKRKRAKLDAIAYEHIRRNGPLSNFIVRNKQVMSNDDFYGWLEAIKLNLV
jgi:hypothetical protein